MGLSRRGCLSVVGGLALLSGFRSRSRTRGGIAGRRCRQTSPLPGAPRRFELRLACRSAPAGAAIRGAFEPSTEVVTKDSCAVLFERAFGADRSAAVVTRARHQAGLGRPAPVAGL